MSSGPPRTSGARRRTARRKRPARVPDCSDNVRTAGRSPYQFPRRFTLTGLVGDPAISGFVATGTMEGLDSGRHAQSVHWPIPARTGSERLAFWTIRMRRSRRRLSQGA